MATAPPTISALPTPPDPNDRSTFNARAYPWSVAQQTLATQANAVAANVYANAQAAETGASTANTKAGEASTSATSASGSATTATDKAGEASNSASSAETSRIEASKLNLGPKAVAPTVNNQGGALLAGATYYDTALARWRVWSGTVWGDGVSVGSGVVAAQINAATAKTTPADADELGITDSAASWGLKKLTFANLKAWIGGLFVSKSGDTMTGQLISKKSFANGASSSNFVAEAEGTAQGQAAGYSFRPTFTGTADNGPRRAADIWASFSGVWLSEKLSFGVGTGTTNDDLNRTIERLAITGTGNVLVTGGGVLGYGAGSGGTVTQITSKTTGVTINKPTGRITMHNAALGAGASVVFVVSNSTVTGHGVVLSGAYRSVDPSSYRIELAFSGAGAFAIRVTNLTADSLSQALDINFSVLARSFT